MGTSNRLGPHLKRAEQALAARKAGALRPLDLTVPQYEALSLLLGGSSMSCACLAREAHVRTPTMTGILGNLLDKGLISRRVSPDHARVNLISLTPNGLELAQKADAIVADIEREVLDAFSARDGDMLARLLDRVTEVAPEAGSGK